MAILAFDIGIKNLAYCQAERVENSIIIKKLEVICLEYDKKKFDTVASSLFKNLRERFDNLQISVVLIENQPVKINPVMKSLQMMIYSYFHLMGADVRMVAAANKTILLNKVDADTAQSITDQLTLSSKYANRKRMAVLIADYFLEKIDTEQHKLFKSAKKKDDIADAFLICINYCNAF